MVKLTNIKDTRANKYTIFALNLHFSARNRYKKNIEHTFKY